jgi:RNA recognition motif-containing protein
MQTKLYVGNLDVNVTNDDLNILFSNHGEVKEAKIIQSKGFGFIEMSNQSEAESARKILNGNNFRGRKLKIDIAVPSKSRTHRRSR